MQKIDPAKITPPYNVTNWESIGVYKIEIINGDTYTTMHYDDWVRAILPQKAFIKAGFYLDEKSGEIARIVGHAPEYVVYKFRRR